MSAPNTELPYRPNVGIMVLNADGKVWIGHRLASNENEYRNQPKLWQMPQGGVDEGEDIEAAAYRELYEETGMSSVTLLARTQNWISYKYPEGVPQKLSRKWSGQKQMWFVFRFTGEESEIRINPPPDGKKAEFDEWRWEDIRKLPDLVVPFKRDVYEQVVQQFAGLADG